jgi:heme a synthase
VLGGLRVLLDKEALADKESFAMLHGMTGPLFFALAVALVVFTSRTWLMGATESSATEVRGSIQIRTLATVTAVLTYLQIVFGAVLRHMPVDSEPGAFMLAVRFHLFLAGALALHVALLVGFVLSRARHVRPLGRLAWAMIGIVGLQLALGAATWIVKFSVPGWAADWVSIPNVAIQEGGWLQTHIITAHVATGSLLLGISVALALYSHRLLRTSTILRPLGANGLEAAV